MTLKIVQRTLTLGLVLLAANSYAQTVPAGYASTSVTDTLPAKSPAVVADDSIRPFHINVGFVRIRNFGFLANRRRATTLPLCFQLLGAAQEPHAQQHTASTEDSPDLYRCPKCSGPMKVIERLTAAEIQLRSPR